jgi:hypothetical protein
LLLLLLIGLSFFIVASPAPAATNQVHWAFIPPVRPEIPHVKNKSWIANPIDNFVLAQLESKKLKPSPPADKITLLRRLSLDTVGLPPSTASLDSFLSDRAANAWQRQVDNLLASPHFGERWGRVWLDAARYADSDGYEKDKRRTVWLYRDYVIGAMNSDMPYDRFIVEQIAGDQLPNATQDQKVATGFLRNSMVNEEGGIDPEQFRMEAMFDRMDCIGKSVLGLTIGCAQCHNHKFDPLTQEEYYRMFAFLNNDHEGQQVVYTPEELMTISRLRREMAKIESDLKETNPDWTNRMAQWEQKVRDDQPKWTVVRPSVEDISTGGQRYLPQDDGSFLALGYAPTKHTAKFWLTNSMRGVTAVRLELLTDPNLPCGGPGRSSEGTCALSGFELRTAPSNAPAKLSKIKFSKATCDYDQPVRDLESEFDDRSGKKRVTGPVSMAIDDDGETAWGIDAGPGRRNVPRKAVFQCATNAGFEDGTIFEFSLQQNHGGWNSDEHMNNNLGRFRFSLTTNSGPVVADPIPAPVREILAIPQSERSPAQVAAVFRYWRTTVSEWRDANQRIDSLWSEWPAGTTSLTLIARHDGRDTHILKRGDFLQPLKPVTPGVPAFLNPLPADAPPTRLSFGKWLADRKSPTTARAIVNRIWQTYFGVGLVNTPEDFGNRSETPSHPELLDWLACELMDNGWSLKHIHRLIVTSQTYRQSSAASPDSYERDPQNRLLSRGSRFRVDAEIVRDIALSASGLMTTNVGGPSVFSPAPAFLFKPPASYAPFEWPEAAGPDRYRRAVYTFRRRSTPYPALQVFDAPNGDFACVRRMRSDTPLQALTTLNEPLFIECSQALAGKTLREAGATDADQVNYIFRRVLGRLPDAAEQKSLLGLLDRQRKRMADGWLNPSEIATGKSELPSVPAGSTPTQLAALTVVSRVVLNLDEAITRE